MRLDFSFDYYHRLVDTHTKPEIVCKKKPIYMMFLF